MPEQVLEVFGIQPDTDLNLMRPNQSLGGFTARALEAIDGYLADEKPGMVLAQGDTTTVLCAALAAFSQRIPFGHVEAGLRTGNLQAPSLGKPVLVIYFSTSGHTQSPPSMSAATAPPSSFSFQPTE